MVGAPDRSAPAEAVLRAFAELCSSSGRIMSTFLEALRRGQSQWARWLPGRIASAVSARRLHLAWPGTQPFFPEASQTWYALMKMIVPRADADQVEETAYFGYPQGVPTVPLQTLCAQTAVRFSERDNVHAGLCSAHMSGPPRPLQARGPREAPRTTQRIFCDFHFVKCKPTDDMFLPSERLISK
mmetsp:Transcript_10666/g.31676  ORF Transcript_10666/g.31676 Transcript_10666/m.31676 type:complete len:185 (-) Transcript_10666:22-576(-)